MLTQFDFELYPDDCEVVEMPLHNQYIFLIQKNGTSSIRKEIEIQQLKVYKNNEIYQLSSVDVYIRNPLQRYMSGINTYVQHLKKDYPYLDEQTCIWFATKYNFLNRHYLPQFLWIINLSRFLSPDCKIRLRKVTDLSNVTSFDCKAEIAAITQEMDQIIKSNISSDLQLWLFLDQMLQDMSGNNLTFQKIIEKIKNHPSGTYQSLVSRLNEITKKIILS